MMGFFEFVNNINSYCFYFGLMTVVALLVYAFVVINQDNKHKK